MTVAVDTSVVVAAFAPWHESHELALPAIGEDVMLPAHCGIETYSTLTRLPEPFRTPGPVAADYLKRRFSNRWLFPPEHDVSTLAAQLSSHGIIGGASYDALVAITVRAHNVLLRTLDQRALRIYESIGVDFELLR